jgi:hypothetical protein
LSNFHGALIGELNDIDLVVQDEDASDETEDFSHTSGAIEWLMEDFMYVDNGGWNSFAELSLEWRIEQRRCCILLGHEAYADWT